MSCNIDIAFWSITNITKDINSGWLFRLIHINGVSLYFIVIYIHNRCNIFYYSYKLLRVWEIGNWNFNSFNINSSSIYRLWFILKTNIILISYSYYNFTNSIHWKIVLRIWSGFSFNNVTLNRFLSLHFILTIVILFIIILHLFALHLTGSSNPLGSNYNNYKISFHSYFSIQDLLWFYIILFIFIFINL